MYAETLQRVEMKELVVEAAQKEQREKMEAVLKRESMADAKLIELVVPELAVRKLPSSSNLGGRRSPRSCGAGHQ